MTDDVGKMAAQLVQQMVLANPYIGGVGITPTVKQAAFIVRPELEAFYGGAAGGGKSAALLMAALMFVQVPRYSAILMRRSLTDLSLPESLIPLSHRWLTGTPARYDGSLHVWHFPSGATLQFGYCDSPNDIHRYKSAAFAFIGFDELSEMDPFAYTFMFSRLRRPADMSVPLLRMRSASNPGGASHDFIKQRFIDATATPDRVFIPAKLEDNPFLDREGYEKSLAQLDPVTRAQLRHGDWSVRPEGNLFKRAWFKIADRSAMPRELQLCRAWDFAATAATAGKDPDWTVGVLLGRAADGRVYVLDVQRIRGTPFEVKALLVRTAKRDGKGVRIELEREGGSSGKTVTDDYQHELLVGYDVHAERPTGNKIERSRPWSAACESGGVYLLRGPWNEDFIEEHAAFPEVVHDDQVDASSQAFAALAKLTRLRAWTAVELGEVFDRRRQQHLTPHDSLMDRIKAARNPDVCHGSSVCTDGANSGR